MGTNVQDVTARAKQLISERKYQDAVRACRRVLLSRPDEVQVRLLLAQALLALGRHDEVRIEMLALSRKAPSEGAVHRLLGEAYIRGGQAEAAANALREALRLDPDDEDARDLLEEVGEVESPAPAETIERWFEPEQTSVESSAGAEAAAAASGPTTSPSTAAPPSVELDAGFAAEAASSAEVALPPIAPKKSMKETLMGLPAPTGGITAPGGRPRSVPPPPPPGMSRPSAPPPPPGISGPSAPPPPRKVRSPKSTMLGMPMVAPPGAPPAAGPPIAPPAAQPPAPVGAPAPFAPAAPPMQPSSTDELDSAALELVGEDTGAGAEDDGTAELSTAELMGIIPGVKESDALIGGGTAEIGSMELAFSEIDPYDELDGGLAPLDGEATQARAFEDMDPLQGEDTRGRPPPVSGDPFEDPQRGPGGFDDETTRGGRKSDGVPEIPPPAALPADAGAYAIGFADPFDDETTSRQASISDPDDEIKTSTHAAAAAAFPDEGIGGMGADPLPPLDGEATHARAALGGAILAPRPGLGAGAGPGGVPAAFAPSAAPGAPPAAVGGTPTPAAGPGEAMPAPPPSRGGLTGLTARLPAWAGREVQVGKRKIPLYLGIALAGIPVLLLVLVVVVVQSIQSSAAEEEIAEATLQASRDGLESTLRLALERDADELDDAAESIARRARLYAMATYEHGYPEAGRTQALLGELGEAELGLPDAKVAAAYLALDEGRWADARAVAVIVDGNALAGEAAYARALTAYLVGDFERASAEVDAAISLQPGAARYGALKARVLSDSGQGDAALAVFESIASVEREPTALLSRAEVRIASGDDTGALEDTTLLVEELSSAVSVRQRAYAELTRAEALLGLGRHTDAARVLTAATGEARPMQSEAFTLRLASIRLALGQLDAARAALGELPEDAARPARRATVGAEIYLAAGDLPGVERVLADAPEGAQTQYLRGRLAEAQGQTEPAQAAYRSAATDPEQFVRATARLGAIQLGLGEAEAAIGVLEPALAREPANIEIVPLMVDAMLREDRNDDAARIAGVALTASPSAPELVIAKARADLAAGQAQAVFDLLTGWVERRPDDANLHATLGEAARQVGQTERAATAFARAIELQPRNAVALAGQVQLALRAGDAGTASAKIEEARAGGVAERDLEFWSAWVQMLRGEGHAVVVALRSRVPSRRRLGRVDDADLLVVYGWGLAQAEADRTATPVFERAARVDPQNAEAHLGLALVRTRRGDLTGAANAIGDAEGARTARAPNDTWLQARVQAARARLMFENGSMDGAVEQAEAAVAVDSTCAEAHLVLAIVADARGTNPIPHLRRALAGRSPPPEVLGQLVLYDDRAEDVCELARRYLAAAPRGIDARDARTLSRRCN